MNKKAYTLQVVGATLYYEIIGAGPILVMIAAGAGDADTYNRLTDRLIGCYTVVTYDRRGYARSPLDDPEQRIEIGTHSDDIHHLLAVLGQEPAYVFGCSIGALIGLDLAMHYPVQIHTLVAHEPPIPALLSATEMPEARRAQQAMQETYRREGSAAAIKQFAVTLGVKHDNTPVNVGLPQQDFKIAEKNREAFFKYDAGAVGRYKLDIPALKAAPTRIVVAGGTESQKTGPYRSAVALAAKLGTTVVEFPGNHAGFVDYPDEFARRLRDVLDD